MIDRILERLREKFKYNSEQAEIWREGSYTDAYFREKKDLYLDRANTYGEAIRIVQEVAKDGGWIPVSERLPEEKETVILSTQLGTYAGCYFCGGWYREDMLCYDSAVREREVIAWQPLPAPYQKGE